MDEADRIPIDIGYEAAGEVSEPQAGQRMTVREDGGLVIDILARPCHPAPSTETEIVVCAASQDDDQLEPLPPPPSPTPMEQLQEALSFKIGPVEVGPGGVDGGAGFSTRMRF